MTQDSSNGSGWFSITVGVLLLALSRWAWCRRPVRPAERRGEGGGPSRMAVWWQRATTRSGRLSSA